MRFRGAALVLVLLCVTGCASDSLPTEPWPDAWLQLPESATDDVLVAVIDGGIAAHPIISDRIVGTWEAEATEKSPRNAHALAMAGLLLGMNPRNEPHAMARITLLDVRVLDGTGAGLPSDIASGIRWAQRMGADVILMSLALSVDDLQIRAAVEDALSSGVLIVASTANALDDSPAYPAELPGVIGVTGVDRDLSLGVLAGSRGADVAAPDDGIDAPSIDGAYAEVSGTSAAAAIAVSVIVACTTREPWDENAVVRQAQASGAAVASDERSIPVLRCIPKEH